jgi:hypothetical protein
MVYLSADHEEVVVDLGLPGISTAGRLYFRVAADGESLDLVRTQVPTPTRRAQPPGFGGVRRTPGGETPGMTAGRRRERD